MTNSDALRLNARLSRGLAQKLAVIKRRTGKTTTEVVQLALDELYESTTIRLPSRSIDSFIGCAEGPAEYSSDYKQEFVSGVAEKFSSRSGEAVGRGPTPKKPTAGKVPAAKKKKAP